MDELIPIPCPFCGKNPRINSWGGWWGIHCPFYACDNPHGFLSATKESVIKSWNDYFKEVQNA